MINALQKSDCVICLTELVPREDQPTPTTAHVVAAAQKIVALPCGHLFHSRCIEQCFAHTTKCPSCRKCVLQSIPGATVANRIIRLNVDNRPVLEQRTASGPTTLEQYLEAKGRKYLRQLETATKDIETRVATLAERTKASNANVVVLQGEVESKAALLHALAKREKSMELIRTGVSTTTTDREVLLLCAADIHRTQERHIGDMHVLSTKLAEVTDEIRRTEEKLMRLKPEEEELLNLRRKRGRGEHHPLESTNDGDAADERDARRRRTEAHRPMVKPSKAAAKPPLAAPRNHPAPWSNPNVPGWLQEVRSPSAQVPPPDPL